MLAGEDVKALETLSRYKAPADFLKAHTELRTKVGERPSVMPVLPADAKPEQVAEYRKAAGFPDIPADAPAEKIVEAFGIKPPDGYKMSPLEQGLVGEFAKLANANHYPPSLVKAATEFFFKSQQSAAQAGDKIAREKAGEWNGKLRQEWGRDYDAMMAASDAYLDQTFTEDADAKMELLNARLPGGGLIADHPAFVKMIADLAMQNGFTDRIQANAMESGGKSLAEQQREIEALQFTNRPAYDEKAKPGGVLDKIIQGRIAKGELDADGNERRRRA